MKRPLLRDSDIAGPGDFGPARDIGAKNPCKLVRRRNSVEKSKIDGSIKKVWY
jgi:hypothetical protein